MSTKELQNFKFKVTVVVEVTESGPTLERAIEILKTGVKSQITSNYPLVIGSYPVITIEPMEEQS